MGESSCNVARRKGGRQDDLTSDIGKASVTTRFTIFQNVSRTEHRTWMIPAGEILLIGGI